MEAAKNRIREEIEKALDGDRLKKAVFSRPRDKSLLKASAEVFYKNGESALNCKAF